MQYAGLDEAKCSTFLAVYLFFYESLFGIRSSVSDAVLIYLNNKKYNRFNFNKRHNVDLVQTYVCYFVVILIIILQMMSALIQGYKIPSNIASIDFNSSCTHFATGGKESIKIFQLELNDKCWFDCKKTIAKYRGANISITRTCVSQLAWNKQGNDFIAIGTTSGYVLVFQAKQAYKNIMQIKGHDGNINNIQWNTGSRSCFVSSSFENIILQWDTRSEQSVAKYQYPETTKIRDLKFNPYNPNYLAVQSSTKLQITDLRMGSNKSVCSYQINNNQLQGISVQWNPNNDRQIASAISKQINVFEISGESFQLKNTLSHYSLIKQFYWMKTKENHFGVLGEHPQKNIFFYDLQDKNRISYMYGGHGRSIDCWKMNNDETILLSASIIKEKNVKSSAAANYGLLVGQYTGNYYDPNQLKYNYPITFDNNNTMAFCLNQDESSSKKNLVLNRKKSNKTKQSSPFLYNFIDSSQWYDRQIKLSSVKEEFAYLYKNYILQGKNEQIAQNNSQVAKRIGKHLCASIWKQIFNYAFPLEEQQHTIDSIYEGKIEADIQIIQNRVTLFNRSQYVKMAQKIDLIQILQELVDQNQLQSAVIISICLMNKNPDLIPLQFMNKIFQPYIQLLHNFQMYEIASDTIMITKNKNFTAITEKDTTYIITCGWCKESISKGNCKCNKLCVLCERSLSQRMVIWCKYCGHGGHATEYQKWFKEDQKQFCPHGCGHSCFNSDDF